MKLRRFITGFMTALLTLSIPLGVSGQDFDDIYYNPAKDKKTATKAKKQTQVQYVPTPDYPAADTYAQPGYTLSKVDDNAIDAYNRRGMFAQTDTADAVLVPLDSLGEFEYTRRIEQFHNPDVVTNTNDQDLIEYYYNRGLQDGLDANSGSVNIYLNGGVYDPFWYPYGYYRPWYDSWYYNNYWTFGPSWSWGWYDPFWGPSWSWGWGPSWSWGWGPGWGPGWGYVPGPAWGYRPSGVGSSRPHAATGAGSTVGRRPGAVSTGAGSTVNRPGNMGRGRFGNTNTVGTSNTGNRVNPASTNQNNGAVSRPGNSGRGRNNAGTTNSNSNNSNYNYNSSSRQSNTQNNNSNWGSSRGSSWGSGGSFGGSRGGGGHYGGGSSGGGRGRGR